MKGVNMKTRTFAAAAVLVAMVGIGCQDTPAGPQLAIIEEVPVDCENIDSAQAEEILRENAVWDHLQAQRPAPTDEELIEAAVLICTGGVTPNPGPR